MMKKVTLLMTIIVVVAGILISFKFIVAEPGENEVLFEGNELMEMEHETAKRVNTLRTEMMNDLLQPSDFREEVVRLMEDMFYHLLEQDSRAENYANALYSSNVIRQMGWALEDRKEMAPEETALQNNNVTVFANEAFDYYLKKGENTDEEADRMRLIEQAKELKENLDRETETYTELVYNWYLSPKGRELLNSK